jgi:hypothetical protein
LTKANPADILSGRLVLRLAKAGRVYGFTGCLRRRVSDLLSFEKHNNVKTRYAAGLKNRWNFVPFFAERVLTRRQRA